MPDQAEAEKTQFVGVQEVAKKLNIKGKVLRRAVKSGRVPGKQEGSRWLVDTEKITIEAIAEAIKNRPKKEKRHRHKNNEPRSAPPEYLTDGVTRWFGVRVESGQEIYVKNILNKAVQDKQKGFETLDEAFIPVRVLVKKSGREITSAMFCRIVFVKTAKISECYMAIKDASEYIKGFWTKTTDHKVPALVETESITALKEIDGQRITEAEVKGITPGARVQILEGPFRNYQGDVIEIIDSLVKVSVPLFGRDTAVSFPQEQLKVVEI